MAGIYDQWKRTARGRTATYDVNNQRSDLHPRVRYLLHRQARTVLGGFGPFIIGVGFGCTCLFYYAPQEKNKYVEYHVIATISQKPNVTKRTKNMKKITTTEQQESKI